MRRILLAPLAVALALPVSAQATPAPVTPLQLAAATADRLGTALAGTEPLSSPGVSLEATVPGTFIGMRKVGSRLVATGTDGLTVFDISHPALPVPMGTVPLPHFENEDVSADRHVAIVSNDRESASRGAVMYVVDITGPVPVLASALNLSDLGSTERGPGHIANCVAPGADPCRTVWLTGGHRVFVVDLRDPAAPKVLGSFNSAASRGSVGFGSRGHYRTGATHDAERDSTGTIWVTGSGGAIGYRLTRNPLHPAMVTHTGRKGTDPRVNDFILHNSKRLGAATLLVTEEDYVDTSEVPPGSCHGQGKFQTWDVRGTDRRRLMRLRDQWKTEVTGVPFLSGNKAPVTANCSSHWFDVSGGLAAVGWYEQGTRLLDVSHPGDIRQVGYWLPPNAVTWGATWITRDIVYTADVGRGIDVLRVDRAATESAMPTVVAPIRASWLGAAPRVEVLKRSEQWSWMCSSVDMAAMHRLGATG